jgi:glycosyltransferase involved in cell wall biosynthesis
MTDHPEVSVVLPTHDRRERMRWTLASALEQRDVDLEVVVVDDGSTDGTSTLLRDVEDPRVRVVRNEKPLGESGARNRGIEEARGGWIAFLDDDDLWAPDKLAQQLQALRRDTRVWAYAGVVLIDEGFRILSGEPPPPPEAVIQALRRHNAVPGSASNVIAAADVLADVGGFDPGLRRTPDWDMWLRLVRVGPPACAPTPSVAICVHPGNVSRDMDTMFAELTTIAERHGIRVDLPRHRRWAAWVSLADGRRMNALRHYAHAVAEGDVRSLGRAGAAMLGPRPRTISGAERPSPWTEAAEAWLAPIRDRR